MTHSRSSLSRHWPICLLLLSEMRSVFSWTIRRRVGPVRMAHHKYHPTAIRMVQDDTGPVEDVTVPTVDYPSMRIKDLQAALKELNVSYTDCFDKESLVKRLQEVREKSKNTATTTIHDNGSWNSTAKLAELRAMTVRELREACSRRNIRWAQFIEKEDLVRALLSAMETAAEFSVSGVMTPGAVTDLTGEQLDRELSRPSNAPLLLDVYATWCGPCQMMAPQLKEAAVQLGDRVRVGKIDSDKYPDQARKLRAAALPTVLVLNGDQELQRIEGALMKDQILRFVEPYII